MSFRFILYFTLYLTCTSALGLNCLLKAKPSGNYFSCKLKYNKRFFGDLNSKLSAQEKLDTTWKHIEDARYQKLPELKSLGVMSTAQLLCPYYAAKAFTHDGDLMKPGRKKQIHTFGTCIKVNFVPLGANNLTGIFKQGSTAGIMRFSLAKEPHENTCIPGMAWKCFVDHKDSLNIMAMNSFVPQNGFNIFQNNFSTVVPQPPFDISLVLVNLVFSSALGIAGQKGANTRAISLAPMARITQDGSQVIAAVAPYEIIFKPTIAAQNFLPSADHVYDFRELLQDKGMYGDNNLVLYKVMARLSKYSEPIEIGRIETASPFIASKFGDEELFFQHQEMMLKE